MMTKFALLLKLAEVLPLGAAQENHQPADQRCRGDQCAGKGKRVDTHVHKGGSAQESTPNEAQQAAAPLRQLAPVVPDI